MSIRSRAIERFQALLHFKKDYVRSRRMGDRRHRQMAQPLGFGLESLEPRVLLSGHPTILGFEVNAGEAQRSIVTSIEVQFSDDVSASLDASDLLIRELGSGSVVAQSDMSVAYEAATNTATITFPGLVGGSLSNGNYTATLVGAGITDTTGQPLDGNGDGQGGDDYSFDLYRYFADANGDRDVGLPDLFGFRQTYQKGVGETGFDPIWDHNGDGDIGLPDLFAFRDTYQSALTVDVIIDVSLNNDTAPHGLTNADGITTDPTVTGRVAFMDQADRVRVGLDGMAVADFVTLSESELGPNGGFLFDQAKLDALFGTLSQSAHTLHLLAENETGVAIAESSVSFELDTALPVVAHISLGSSIEIEFSEFFDKFISPSAITLTSFGGDGLPGGGDDALIEILHIGFNEFGRHLSVTPTGSLANGNYRLTIDPARIADRVGNTLGGSNSFDFTINPANDIQPLSGTAKIIGSPAANVGQVIGFQVPWDPTSETYAVFQTINAYGTFGTTQVDQIDIDPFTQTVFFTVPQYAVTGDVTIHGTSSVNLPLQIVPTLTNVYADYPSSGITLLGRGFVEGDGIYRFPGLDVVDPGIGTETVDVSGQVTSAGRYVDIDLPVHGFGDVTVTTSGGTSAPFPTHYMSPNRGVPLGITVDGTDLWMVPHSSNQLFRLSMSTGQVLSSVLHPFDDFTSTGETLDILTSSLNLAGVVVPAGSLLVGSWIYSLNRIAAIDPSDGTVLSMLTLPFHMNVVDMAYDTADGGHLYVLDKDQDEVVEIDSVTGEIIGSFKTPSSVFFRGGLTVGPEVDPSTGRHNLWIATDSERNVSEVTSAGTVVRQIDLSSHSRGSAGIGPTDLAFDDSGRLLASSTRQVVYRFDLDLPSSADVTLTSINAFSIEGVPADFALASANTGQLIELVGTNLDHPGLRVLFPTRDNVGVMSVASEVPMVSEDGTRAQVIVPEVATTGDVAITIMGSQNLGFSNLSDAIHRDVSVSFIATRDTALLSFRDSGLNGLPAESWGLDNVSVVKSSDGTPVFEDDFEGGADFRWSDGITDKSVVGYFSEFLGRINGIQDLTLDGLTAGEQYDVTFDLYILDQWVGIDSQFRNPDIFEVRVDDQILLSEAFTNSFDGVQTFVPAHIGKVPLQIVPVLDGLIGLPGFDYPFDLLGSGFMEGASTVTIGGTVLKDIYTNDDAVHSVNDVSLLDGDVLEANSKYRLVSPLSLEFPIRVTTAGGWDEVGGVEFEEALFGDLVGIESVANSGLVADPNLASANTGQDIVLTGQGFTGFTLVHFEAVDDTGVSGLITRFGLVSDGGTRLTVRVPVLAKTGSVRVLGDDTVLPLQIVPTLRSIGGTIGEGNKIVLEGTGLVEGDVSVTIDDQPAVSLDVTTVAGTYTFLPDYLDQQVVDLTVPAGVSDGVVVVTTAGGSFTLEQSLTGISSTASSGAAARSGIGSANTGQTITLAGVGLQANEQVVFTQIDDEGFLSTIVVTPTSIASNGTSLEVVVPTTATSGMVRLAREQAGRFLQVVPTVTDVENLGILINKPYQSKAYHDADIRILGSGFAEGAMTVHFGDQSLVDSSTVTGSDVDSTTNDRVELTVPNGVPFGPIWISTLGGSSEQLGRTFDTIVSTADSGTPADDELASANPGQLITLTGSGFDSSTNVVFQIHQTSGNVLERIVHPSVVNETGTQLTVVVPTDAVTGSISIVGDQTNREVPLQIVPVLDHVDLISVNSTTNEGDRLAKFRLRGVGFIESNGTTYSLGSAQIVDLGASTGPDVGSDFNGIFADVTVPIADNPFGMATVTTSGGTSAPFGVDYTGINSVAFSGTPADTGQASANAGQVVTLTGSGLSTNTDVVGRYISDDGIEGIYLLNPTSTSVGGTSATVLIPDFFNGVFALNVVGSSSSPLLQIVPVLTSIQVRESYSKGTFTILAGTGFVSGNESVYAFGDELVTDGDVDFFSGGSPPQSVTLSPSPRHGIEAVTVTTTGGTSAPLTTNFISLTQGPLRSIAFDGTDIWVAPYQGNQLHRLSATTGQVLSSIALPNDIEKGIGLEVLRASINLSDVVVPAGTLLVSHPSGQITAIDPLTGSVLSMLVSAAGPAAVDLAYDPADGGHLYVLEDSANEVVEIDPVTGDRIGSFDAPITPNSLRFKAGLTLGSQINPDTGRRNLWISSDHDVQDVTVTEMTSVGKAVRQVGLLVHGVGRNVTGIAFDAVGNLLASTSDSVWSTNGVIYQLNLDLDLSLPNNMTVTSINGLAWDGTPANSEIASANEGQVVEIVGTNLDHPGLRVLFSTRNEAGEESLKSVAPTATNDDGTRIQVRVPVLATTGDVTLTVVATEHLGNSSSPSAIYGDMSVSFTASDTSARISFGGSGGSFGIDNVSVSLSSDGTQVFLDDFESGADPRWSDPSVNDTVPENFTDFSGYFSDLSQTLDLGGLVAGQQYDVTFDLYIAGGWEGLAADIPDEFQVWVDGQALFREALSTTDDGTQAFVHEGTGSVPIQIVPTITELQGKPGDETTFDLLGSGFMEGASTVTVGGVNLVDMFAIDRDSGQALIDNDVLAENAVYRLISPLSVEGPIRVTTAGGWFEWLGPAFDEPLLDVDLVGIESSAVSGSAADLGAASANTGQDIVLTGQGFISDTLVQFAAVDDTGVSGVITRTGLVTSDGTRLTVRVPALARTGSLRVVGDDTALPLQIVPTVRSIGGEISDGGVIVLEGTGLVEGGLSVTIDGQPVVSLDVIAVADGSTASNGSLDQQLVELTVPAGVSDGVVVVSTAGGSFILGTSLTGIDSVASSGVAARSALGSANTDQVITLTGLGLLASDDVVFTRIDVSGRLSTLVVAPISVASNGTSLEVRVPTTATSGMVRLARETVGLFLQVVPTVTAVEGLSPVYHGGTLSILGSGFSEGGIAVHFGNQVLVDSSVVTGVDVDSASNGRVMLTVPDGVPFGPFQVSTLGGISEVFGSTFDAIVSTAQSGTPANAAVASANPGQTITLMGSGFSSRTGVAFETNADGQKSVEVRYPTFVNSQGTTMTVQVPNIAVTGSVSVFGDHGNTQLPLQIVPILSDVSLVVNTEFRTGVATVHLSLTGGGFIEGEGTTYTVGGVPFVDMNELGVIFSNDVVNGNEHIRNFPYREELFGPVTVTTAGGTSVPFSVGFTGINSVATSGTPADPVQASANAGQTIELVGSGFSTSSDVVITYTDQEGVLFVEKISPNSVSAGGTLATLTLPNYVNGAFGVRVMGSSASILLQIVPTLTSVEVDFSNTVARGTGFVEGNGSIYAFGSLLITDSDTSTVPVNVGGSTTAVIRRPVHGFDTELTVTTSGGTSESLPINALSLDLGQIHGLAFDGTDIWVAPKDGDQLHRVSSTTGQVLSSVTRSFGESSSISFQVLTSSMSLAGVVVPAGTFLVSNLWQANPDQIVAIDPLDGSVLSTLTLTSLADEYVVDLTYDSADGGHLYALVNTYSNDEVVEINSVTGEVLGRFNTPSDISNGASLTVDPAINPVTGRRNLWINASLFDDEVIQVTSAGTLVGVVSLLSQGVDDTFFTGIIFDDEGKLLASSWEGVVYRLNV